jgi:hypothetical protein
MAEMPVGMTLCPTKSPEAKFERFLRRRSALRDKAGVGAVWFNVGFRAKLVML